MLPIVGDITTGGWVRLVGVMTSRGDGWSSSIVEGSLTLEPTIHIKFPASV